MTINNMVRNGMFYSGGVNGLYNNNPYMSLPFLNTDSRVQPGSYWQLPNVNSAASQKENVNTRVSGREILKIIQDIYAQNARMGFSDVNPVVSDNAKASIFVDNAKTASSVLSKTFSLDIKQTALAQTNSSGSVNSSAKDYETGIFSFAIDAGGKTRNFTINVSGDDTNESIQRKMAAVINSSDIGTKAEVIEDKEKGTSVLSISSKETGVKNSFSITDTSGDLAELMGITAVSTQARDAVYTVDKGYERTSSSNEITVSPGVNVTMKEAGKTDISFKRDPAEAVKAVKDIVGAINSAIRNASEIPGRGSAKFISDLSSMNRTYSQSLARMGISVSRTGELSVDEGKLTKAAESNGLGDLFSNRQFGFGARLEQIASNAARSNAYFSPSQPVIFGYSGGKVNYFNFSTAGSLFDLII